MGRHLARAALAAAAFFASGAARADGGSATLRLDLLHGGDRTTEWFQLDRVTEVPFPCGDPKKPIDGTNLGQYIVRVWEIETNRLLYTRGFSCLFWEWRTTDEAAVRPRALPEVVRIPKPPGPVRVEIGARERDNSFRPVFSASIDPDSLDVSRGKRRSDLVVRDVMVNGPSETRVDLLFVSEGYRADQMEKFRHDVSRLTEALFAWTPYRELRERFNVRAIEVPSRDSGPGEPRKGLFPDTAFSLAFNTFGIARYMAQPDVKALHDAAGNAPFDQLIVLVNTARYGGGGVFNAYNVTVSDNPFDEYVLVHEFGHGFAALGDEYFDSAVAYNEYYPAGVEPWEKNITANGTDPKWRDLVTPGVPLPTPPDAEKFGAAVGAFEGAGYAAKGLFRARIDCKMIGKGHVGFCAPCDRGIRQVIDLYSSGAPE
jgi:hypothetical protein